MLSKPFMLKRQTTTWRRSTFISHNLPSMKIFPIELHVLQCRGVGHCGHWAGDIDYMFLHLCRSGLQLLLRATSALGSLLGVFTGFSEHLMLFHQAAVACLMAHAPHGHLRQSASNGHWGENHLPMERHIWTDFHPDYLKMDSRYTVDPMRSSDVDSEHGNSTKNNMEGDDITMTQLQRLKRETVPQSSTVQASVNPGFHHPSPKSFPSKLLARRQMLKACHHSGVMVTTNHSPRNWVEHPGVSPGSFSVRGFSCEGSRVGSIS